MFFTRTTFLGLICFAALSLPAPSEAGEWSVGGGVLIGSSEYKDTDPRVFPFPLVGYEGERFYLRGLTAGAHIWKDEVNELSVNIGYLPQQFDASKSDDWAMRQLDDRDSTAVAGAAYRLTTEWGVGRVGVSADILDTSNGFLADAAYLYPIRLDAFTLTPGVGILWTSGNYNDYYYGISGSESRRSGLSEYRADDAFSPYAELTANYALTEHLGLYVNGRVMFLDDEIADSPMVDTDKKYSLGTGVSWTF